MREIAMHAYERIKGEGGSPLARQHKRREVDPGVLLVGGGGREVGKVTKPSRGDNAHDTSDRTPACKRGVKGKGERAKRQGFFFRSRFAKFKFR